MPVWMRRDKHSSGRLDGCIHILGTGESKWDGSVLRWSTCRMVGVNIYIAVQCQGSRCTLPLPLGHRAGPGHRRRPTTGRPVSKLGPGQPGTVTV